MSYYLKFHVIVTCALKILLPGQDKSNKKLSFAYSTVGMNVKYMYIVALFPVQEVLGSYN
jgi:hypothetical protein